MRVEKLSNNRDVLSLLKKLGVDGGGVKILASKMKHHIIKIYDLHVGAANILKQDALSIGADVAVPRGTVIASTKSVDCIVIATQRELEVLAKKELSQPFGLKKVALELHKIAHLHLPQEIEIMGVVNTNDDSFFQESRFNGLNAVKKIESMIAEGADIIDIGAVSSRPNALKVSVEEELSRLAPILEAIRTSKLYENAKFSIDSYQPLVIQKALESGFKIVNDITGLDNEHVCRLCATYNATAVIMHMQGNPQTMQLNPSYSNVTLDIYDFFQERISRAESFGVEDIIVDIGIGFGKTLEHNIELIQNLENFLSLKRKVLVGASRKSMIDAIYKSEIQERLPGTLMIHMEAIRNGASIIRVHDVKEHVQSLKVFRALNS